MYKMGVKKKNVYNFLWASLNGMEVVTLYVYMKKPPILRDPYWWFGLLAGFGVINFVIAWDEDIELEWVKNPERR